MKNFQVDKRIFQKYKVKLAYLFGSQAKGTSAKESDFDIAVLFKKNPSDPLALEEISLLSEELNKFFLTSVDIVCLNNAPLLLKYEVVSYGKVIYCDDEFERINYEVSIVEEYIDEAPIRKLYNEALYKRILQGA